jgi:uncharacterized protein YjiS (DUF1127 family)
MAKTSAALSRSPPRWRDLQLPNLCYRSHPRWEIDANVLIGSSGVESVVSNSTNAACVGAHRSSPWGQLNLLLDEWWQRSRSRNELESLDDAMLRDIGLSHREAGSARQESRYRSGSAIRGSGMRHAVFSPRPGSVSSIARSKGASW